MHEYIVFYFPLEVLSDILFLIPIYIKGFYIYDMFESINADYLNILLKINK
jgi:hypothetical protein